MAELLFQYFGWTTWIVGISYWGLPPLFLGCGFYGSGLGDFVEGSCILIYPLFLVGNSSIFGGASVGCIEVSSPGKLFGIGLVYCIALS